MEYAASPRRCASHASAYVQQDMDSGVNALLLRFFLKNTSIADLQTVQRIGVQCAPATNTASPLCLCLQKALKASAQGNAGLKPKEGEVTSRPWQWPINYKV